ncbi:MAG: UDP-N-acetylmuramate--L-alanine ligase [Cellvibrionales bacterium]|jgi:UDP-N-acetylmuramate--alanine ligase|nr:UDP-N-acetylmuramate--L-alanine ligase [Cellvibrionales bacterium]
MNIKLVEHIYFIGIGGIGMSALARYFNAKGLTVSGYDKTPSAITQALSDEGINLHFDDNYIPQEILESDFQSVLIVYTPAVSMDSPQLTSFSSKKWNVLKRAELLGLITEDAFTIAVAGTHGKTTTSCILAHLLRQSGIDCTAFLGGISNNYNSNLLISQSGNIVVVEADEYDRSFLKLSPDISIITSVDPDHLDVYENAEDMRNTFKKFASNTKSNGLLLVNKSIDIDFDPIDEGSLMTYSASLRADNVAINLSIEKGSQQFDANFKDLMPGQVYEYELKDIQLQLPGKHNVENALAAIVVASSLGAKPSKLKSALADFKGVKRRYDLHAKGKYVYIDDYAHHPEEIKATLIATRELFPEKKITVAFQPHLYSRTRDFASDFGDSLSLADEVLLLDIYPARELPIEGVNSKMLLAEISDCKKSLVEKQNLVNELTNPKRELLLTLGAGDIDQFVEPLKHNYVNEMG